MCMCVGVCMPMKVPTQTKGMGSPWNWHNRACELLDA